MDNTSYVSLPMLFLETTTPLFSVPGTENTTAEALASDPPSVYMFEVALMLYRVFMPIIFIFGIFGNIMIIIIQRRISGSYGSSLSTYFSSLAVSDMVSFSHGIVLFLERVYLIPIVASHSFVCKMVNWLVYVTGNTSSWFLVIMTFQRAASTIWPHKIDVICTTIKARMAVCVITLTSLAVNAHILYGIDVVGGVDEADPIQCTFKTPEYKEFFDKTWPLTDILLSSGIPSVLLLVSNVVLIRTVYQSMQKMRNSLSVGNQTNVFTARESATLSLTITLITASVAFFVLTTPICVLFITQGYLANEAYIPVVYAVAYCLWYFNNAINFYLYCLTGKRYRSQFLDIFGCSRGQKPAKRGSRSTPLANSKRAQSGPTSSSTKITEQVSTIPMPTTEDKDKELSVVNKDDQNPSQPQEMHMPN